MLIGYRAGDMWAPQLPLAEALQTEARHFVECIDARRTPITDGQAGLRVVRLLEAATQSMVQHGTPVPLGVSSTVV
jgi:predicted dehydrogenase